MKARSLISLLSCGLLQAQPPVDVELELVPDTNDTSVNKLTVDIAALGGEDSQVTEATGAFTAKIAVDPTTGQATELTFIGGAILGTDLSFTLPLGAGANITNIAGTLITDTPPGTINGATGVFETEQHSFELNDGMLTGTGTAAGNDLDLEESPFGGTLTGTGTLELVSMGTDYMATVILPIDTMQTAPLGTFPIIGTVTADVTVTGTLRMQGLVSIPEVEETYATWAVANGVDSVAETDFTLSPTLTNRLVYALGFNSDNAPVAIFSISSNGYGLNLGFQPIREPVTIEFSETLGEWDDAEAAQFISGQAKLEAGFTGDVGLSRTEDKGFYRVSLTTTP